MAPGVTEHPTADAPAFISRLTLRRDADALGEVARLLREGLDAGRAHRLLWTLFAGDPEASRDFLFLAGEGARSPDGDFLVVSRRKPVDQTGLWRIEAKPYDPVVSEGQVLAFKLRANPTVDRAGKRHDVVMDRKRSLGPDRDASNARIWEEAGADWLRAREGRLGARLLSCRADAYRLHRFQRHQGGQVSFSSLDLSGSLCVTDPDRLRTTLLVGIGRARAWGCGLLLVKPA